MNDQLTKLILLCLLLPTGAFAQALPEPLTLDAALATADNTEHYSIIEIDERLQAIEASAGILAAENGFKLNLKGRLREVGQSQAAGGGTTGDSAASLVLTRPIYDFGQSGAEENLLVMQARALQVERDYLIQQRRLAILDKYFAVLNADNAFITANEALAIGFIRFDRAQERQELGLVAEIEVLRLQADYEVIRQQLYLTQNQQRLSRALLAEEMGFPDQPPSDLESPKIDVDKKISINFESLFEQAMQHSLAAARVKLQTDIAAAAIRTGENSDNPSVDFEVEASSYERDSQLRDEWRASVYVDIPLFGKSTDASTDLQKANFRQALSQQQRFQTRLRLQLLELWQAIQQWQLTVSGAAIAQDYREMYLDRSRAEYELEFNTDLGDSMIEYSRSNADRLEAVYAFELNYRKLAALVGDEFLLNAAPAQ